jgi:hypothetical protein
VQQIVDQLYNEYADDDQNRSFQPGPREDQPDSGRNPYERYAIAGNIESNVMITLIAGGFDPSAQNATPPIMPWTIANDVTIARTS